MDLTLPQLQAQMRHGYGSGWTGIAASALACTRAGAQSSIPGHADVSAFLDAHPATASAERLLARCLGPR